MTLLQCNALQALTYGPEAAALTCRTLTKAALSAISWFTPMSWHMRPICVPAHVLRMFSACRSRPINVSHSSLTGRGSSTAGLNTGRQVPSERRAEVASKALLACPQFARPSPPPTSASSAAETRCQSAMVCGAPGNSIICSIVCSPGWLPNSARSPLATIQTSRSVMGSRSANEHQCQLFENTAVEVDDYATCQHVDTDIEHPPL
jgi:hypothetical protein